MQQKMPQKMSQSDFFPESFLWLFLKKMRNGQRATGNETGERDNVKGEHNR